MILIILAGDNMPEHLYFMRQAFNEALKAFKAEETPVGCVIVFNDNIIGRACNMRNTFKNVLRHAEITAIDQACAFIGDWRLEGCRLYVTVEPCAMCAGAIIQARIEEVIFGAINPKAGCAGSVLNILSEPRFNHQARIISGVMEDKCSRLMRDFFKRFR
jgi:tRNA(adenine34) deaminase